MLSIKFLIFIIYILSLASCTNKGIITAEIKQLQSKPLIFPETDLIFNDCNNTNKRESLFNADYKLIIYYDSTLCNICVINKLYLWDSIQNNIKEINDKGSIIHLFAPSTDDIDKLNSGVLWRR